MVTNGNANAIPFFMLRRRASFIPPAIKEAMVLWYDISRQGCTNENMAVNPVLRDLSGNGHDATCYNFAWAEESGISTKNYPGALVSDGVDDYVQVAGLPLFNTTDGYTVICSREWITTETDDYMTLAGKSHAQGVGSFIFERINSSGKVECFSFGNSSDYDNLYNQKISAQTRRKYNENTLRMGNAADSDSMTIFCTRAVTQLSNIALYSFLLFNRDLTDEEIEWVKKNMGPNRLNNN